MLPTRPLPDPNVREPEHRTTIDTSFATLKDLSLTATCSSFVASCETTDTTRSHPHLEHNKGELARLREQVRPFLFEEEN